METADIKIAIRSEGGDHGLALIEYLKSIGGNNPCKLQGRDNGMYNFINRGGDIDYAREIPTGYPTLKLII
jgi:hypothetical protein